MSGRLFQLFCGMGGDFQELGYRPHFALFWLALELSWRWWVCHLASVLQRAYNDAQGPLEVKSSVILDLVGSNPFMSHPQGLCHSFKRCALPPSLLFQQEGLLTQTLTGVQVVRGTFLERAMSSLRPVKG